MQTTQLLIAWHERMRSCWLWLFRWIWATVWLCSCIEGKMHRQSFRATGSRCSRCGQLVHFDTVGRFEVQSLGNNSHICVFVDDYSGMTFVCPMKHKFESVDATKWMVTVANKQGHQLQIGQRKGVFQQQYEPLLTRLLYWSRFFIRILSWKEWQRRETESANRWGDACASHFGKTSEIIKGGNGASCLQHSQHDPTQST